MSVEIFYIKLFLNFLVLVRIALIEGFQCFDISTKGFVRSQKPFPYSLTLTSRLKVRYFSENKQAVYHR